MKLKHISLLISISLLGLIVTFAAAQESQSDRRFKQWDKNKDGKLSRDELPENAKRNFDRVDTNKDDSISAAEHDRFVNRGRSQQAAASNQTRDRRRTNRKMIVHSDLAYADTDNDRQKLDLFLPKNRKTDKPLPLVAFIHGGGWRNGSKNGGMSRVARFVDSGDYVGASIGYRLSGEAIWPAQIHDCKAAIRWLKGNSKKYGIDPDRICVYGTSAGGHLVAMLGVSGDVKELEGKLGSHLDQDSRVACVVDFFGPTNFLTMNDFPGRIDHDAEDSPESLVIGGAIQKNKKKTLAAAPASYVTADDAPILLMHGTKDPLVPFDQSVQFHKQLVKVKVPAVLVPVTDGEHGFRGNAVDARVDAFVSKFLRGTENEISDEPIPAQ